MGPFVEIDPTRFCLRSRQNRVGQEMTMISNLQMITIYVSDLERALDFYANNWDL